jgi:oligopeptide/dipeptide ABC transporter ATP-binding protein
MAEPLLDVVGLRVQFDTDDGLLTAVDGVDFTLEPAQVLGIVGESGSGKSVTALTLLGLTRAPNVRYDGEVRFGGRNLLALSDGALRSVRGRQIAMIFQDPMTSLNPVHRVGAQIVEMIRAHEPVSRRVARRRAIDLLKQAEIPGAAERVDSFPHEFSGGMRQRAMIAMALACEPAILIADEPTTALDVTIQAQILELIGRLQQELEMAVIMITHDLGVVADIADRVAVMYAGRIVEHGEKRQIFYDSQMPYTWGLLSSIPRLDRAKVARLPSIPGAPPSLISPPHGCRFAPRCRHAFSACDDEPALERRAGGPGHLDRCWLDADRKQALRLTALRAQPAAA